MSCAPQDAFVGMLGLSSVQRPEAVRILDVAGGTGDIAFRMAQQLSRPGLAAATDAPSGRIVVSDINQSMLDVGMQRAMERGRGSFGAAPELEWVAADAEQLPFDACSFDFYTIAFGIRNVTNIDNALREARPALE